MKMPLPCCCSPPADFFWLKFCHYNKEGDLDQNGVWSDLVDDGPRAFIIPGSYPTTYVYNPSIPSSGEITVTFTSATAADVEVETTGVGSVTASGVAMDGAYSKLTQGAHEMYVKLNTTSAANNCDAAPPPA